MLFSAFAPAAIIVRSWRCERLRSGIGGQTASRSSSGVNARKIQSSIGLVVAVITARGGDLIGDVLIGRLRRSERLAGNVHKDAPRPCGRKPTRRGGCGFDECA